jgi:surface-anchored protein
MRMTRRLLTAAGIAAAIVLGTAGTAGAEPISTGHVDIVDVDYAAGALTVQALVNGVERDPATVELVVSSGARTTVPSNAAYSFLGAPGDPVWILPQTQNANLLWPGWNATDVPSGVFGSNTLQMTLTSVTGGELAIYSTGLGGPTVLFDTDDSAGNGLPDTRPLAVGAHTHANWAFSSAGTYTVTFRVSGTLTNGTTVSDDATYTFTVQA